MRGGGLFVRDNSIAIARSQKQPQWPFTVNRQSPQAANLENWWPANQGGLSESSASFEYQDLIQNNNFFITNQATVVSQEIGPGLSIGFTGASGTSGRVNSVNTATITGNPDFTISSWVYIHNPVTQSIANSYAPLIYWGIAATGQSVYFCPVRNGTPGQFFIGFFNTGQYASSIPTNQWIHACWVRTGGGNSQTGNVFYLNGIDVGALTNDGTASTPNISVSGGIQYSFGGAVGSASGNANNNGFDMRIYRRALRPAEVFQLYNPSSRWELYAKPSQSRYFSGFVSNKTQSVSDSVTVTDAEIATVSKVLTDSVSPTDALVKALSKVLTDSVSPTDVEVASVSKVLSDSVSPTDAVTTLPGKSVSDSVTVTDVEVASVSKVLSDSVSSIDSEVATPSKALSDSVTVTDSVTATPGKNVSDSVTVMDSFSRTVSYARSVADSVTVTDAIAGTPPTVSLLLPSPASGLVGGGDNFIFIGSALSMAGVSDNFTSSSLDPLKFSTSTLGTGSVTILPATPQGTVQFDSGATAGSAAILYSATVAENSDVEIQVKVGKVAVPNGAAVELSLGAFIDANNLSRAILRFASDGSCQLRYYNLTSGQVTIDLPLAEIASSMIASTVTLRLLRVMARTILTFNGQVIIDTPAGTSNSMIEVRVANDSSVDSRLMVSLNRYTRTPVVLFGTEPAVGSLTRSNSRVDGVTPEVSLDGMVDVTIDAWAATSILSDGFTYFFDPALTNVRIGTPSSTTGRPVGQLTIIDDPIVTGQQR